MHTKWNISYNNALYFRIQRTRETIRPLCVFPDAGIVCYRPFDVTDSRLIQHMRNLCAREHLSRYYYVPAEQVLVVTLTVQSLEEPGIDPVVVVEEVEIAGLKLHNVVYWGNKHWKEVEALSTFASARNDGVKVVFLIPASTYVSLLMKAHKHE